MSHSACKPVQASVLGQRLDDVTDIRRIGDLVREKSLDLLQADHTLSGIDVAMWDLLGKVLGTPVYALLGYARSYPKMPYASVLFGETPQGTLEKARQMRRLGYRAGKFGWGSFGQRRVRDDVDQVVAAREGLGEDGVLLIDAGTVWVDDVERASQRLPVLQDCRATWLEEPFVSGALAAYRRLAACSGTVKLAGGEGAHNYHMARHMIDYAGIGYVQVDAGRIGGISVAKQVADYAGEKGVTFVNHTFTSHLALSASLQPYAGVERHHLCEYPIDPKPLAVEMTREHLVPGPDGQIRLPDQPGLGITPDLEAVRRYLVDVEIRIDGKILYQTPFI
jgi:L-alanine-DL-glutamate epimerase-like enolase superfamily enzyme